MKPPKIKDYPRFIKVAGEEWRIKFVRNIRNDDGTPTTDLGLCDPSDKTIYIRLKQTRAETLKTVIHELLHAIEEEYGFDLPHTDENDVVAKLERGLASIVLGLFE